MHDVCYRTLVQAKPVLMATRADVSIVSPQERSTLGRSNREVVTARKWREEWTTKDAASVRLQLLGGALCCRSKPRIRWIRSKGAILVLLWNCLILDYYGNLGPIIAGILPSSSYNAGGEVYLAVTLIQALSLMLLYPLAGWIADVYFGRYRVIKTSLWLMWTGTILFSSSLCISMLLSPSQWKMQIAVKAVFLPIAVLAMEAGTAGFKANAIPFGIDQLSTGSGDQLSGFITWFVFTLFTNIGILSFPFSCPLLSSYSFLLRLLFQAVLLSVVLVLESFCRHWLAMEPHTSNPFKLVAQVLNYARKNKQPLFRSAFTYQEDIKPSRIDYAKTCYGGPFSTEEVENVKTFLRIVCALIPMGAILVLCTYAGRIGLPFSMHISSGMLSCYAYQAVSVNFPFIFVVFTIPFYEFILHPLLHNYIPSMLTRVGIGIILLALCYAAFFTIDILGHRTEPHEQGGSLNYTCLFDESAPPQQLNINPLWTILPESLSGLAILFSLIAVYEFVFSQSPYNMKGLLMGAVYATEGAFQFLGLAIQFPFHLGFANDVKTLPTCGPLYMLVLLALTAVWFVVYVLVACGYRKRERGETKRQQDYTEEYYSKYLSPRHH